MRVPVSQHPWADVRDRQGKLSTARVVPRDPPFKQPLMPLHTQHLPLRNSELSVALSKACSLMYVDQAPHNISYKRPSALNYSDGTAVGLVVGFLPRKGKGEW